MNETDELVTFDTVHTRQLQPVIPNSHDVLYTISKIHGNYEVENGLTVRPPMQAETTHRKAKQHNEDGVNDVYEVRGLCRQVGTHVSNPLFSLASL